MIQVDAPSLRGILQNSKKVEGRAGETRLDWLVREASFDNDLRTAVLNSLAELPGQLSTSDEWHAMQVLIGQLHLTNIKLGERVIEQIDCLRVADEAALWAAYSGIFLGATLKATTIKALETSKRTQPVQWFELMRDTQEVKAVGLTLQAMAKVPELRAEQALEIVRSYKRWATNNGIHWNVALSNFLRALPDEVEKNVSAKIARSLGPSFSIDVMAEPTAISVLVNRAELPITRLYQRENIQRAMEQVAADIDKSHSRALEAA